MEPRLVECAVDGVGQATFICRHLREAGDRADGAERVGVASADPTPDNPWPDAWCAACDDHLMATGGTWTEENEVEIVMVCHRCYERIRAANDVDGRTWERFEAT
jgi:hypothetical protein